MSSYAFGAEQASYIELVLTCAWVSDLGVPRIPDLFSVRIMWIRSRDRIVNLYLLG
jgi:hypothetical protein